MGYRRVLATLPHCDDAQADMLQISTWEKQLEKMRAGQTIIILHVESRKLKQTLILMTTAKLDAMKGLVKDLACATCKNQLIEYKQSRRYFNVLST